MKLKFLLGAGATAAMFLGLATPAWAHVTVDPATAPKGGEATIRFRVPNEQTNLNVVKVDIAFPTDHPLLGVDVEPVAGWTSTVTEVKLNPPVQTDDGPVAQAVSEIVWSANSGGFLPGQFQEFPVLVQRLPTDSTAVVFKALQSYSDGSIVRWIDPVVAGQAAPDHPTPILTLTAPDATASPGTASTAPAATSGPAVDVSKLAKKSTVTTTETLAIVGVAFGALGVILALVAVARKPPTDTEAVA